MMTDVEIITYEDYEDDVYQVKHRLDHGSSMLVLTRERMEALKKGLVIACNDGEYCTFVLMKKEEK